MCISVVIHAGVVRWSDCMELQCLGYAPGQMGRDAFYAGSGRIKRFLPFILSVTLSRHCSCSFHLSLPLFFLPLSIELALWIELGSVSAIEWLKLMTHYLPL